MSPPSMSRAAAVAPAATPGVTLKSLASACASHSSDGIPCRSSCRAQIRARTRGEGWRNSSAYIMRRSTVGQVCRAALVVHNVGTPVSSSRRFMNTLEPSDFLLLRPVAPRNHGNIEPVSESRSSISSNSRIELRQSPRTRCARRSSWRRSPRLGSRPCSSASPTLYILTPSRCARVLQNCVFPVPGGPYNSTLTPRLPASNAPAIRRSTWSRPAATWSKSDHSSSVAGARSNSSCRTSAPLRAGACTKRNSRCRSLKSPSSSTDTSPDRTSGAPTARRRRNVPMETPSTLATARFPREKNCR